MMEHALVADKSFNHPDEVNSVQILNNKLTTACDDGKIRLYDRKTRELVRTFEGHNDFFVCEKFSSDEKYILSGSSDRTSKVFCVQTGELIRTLVGHDYAVRCVDISNDNIIVTGSDDYTCKLYYLEDILQKREGLVTTDNNEIECIRTFEGHALGVTAVVFTSDAKRIVTGSYDNTLKLWCVESGNELRTFRGHSSYVYCLSISLDDKYIVSGSNDKSVFLWSLETGEILKKYQGHKHYVNDVSISSNNDFIVTASADDLVKIWNRKDARCIYALKGHTDCVSSISLSSDDVLLVTGSSDRTVRTLDLSTIPNIPGIAWKVIRPFVMVRWLVDNDRASPVLTSTAINNIDNEQMKQQEDQVMISFIKLEIYDVFKHILTFLFVPPVALRQDQPEDAEEVKIAEEE